MNTNNLFYLSPPPKGGEISVGTLKPSLVLALPLFIFSLIVAALFLLFLEPSLQFFQYHIYTMAGVFFDYESSFLIIATVVCSILFLPVLVKVLQLKTTAYEFTTRRIYYSRGILNRSRDQLEIARIRDVASFKPFLLRLFGRGNVMLDTADRSHPFLNIPAQKKPDELKEWVHSVNIAERDRLNYREFENTN
ncbi:PH domain-containing protein [Halomonas sp. 3D7M]|uniref:PH domain-containing protein n=1 Tax=Halomonas sp. 3D7M TaxID=2742617 RepID=UPI001868BC8E|nr:PH domain-containing protein [Halomonas sp. 3D7M]